MSHDDAPPAPPLGSISTVWTRILGAQRVLKDLRERGLSDARVLECQTFLYERYHASVEAYLRAAGHGREAEDLAQSFFLTFFEKGWLERADPARGHFRGLLEAMAERYARDVSALAQRRFEKRMASLDPAPEDERRRPEVEDPRPARGAFRQAWVASLLERSLAMLDERCRGEGRELWARAVRAWLDAVERGERPSYEALSAGLGVRPNQLRNALERGKDLLRRLLVGEVRESVLEDDEAALHAEVCDLLRIAVEEPSPARRTGIAQVCDLYLDLDTHLTAGGQGRRDFAAVSGLPEEHLARVAGRTLGEVLLDPATSLEDLERLAALGQRMRRSPFPLGTHATARVVVALAVARVLAIAGRPPGSIAGKDLEPLLVRALSNERLSERYRLPLEAALAHVRSA